MVFQGAGNVDFGLFFFRNTFFCIGIFVFCCFVFRSGIPGFRLRFPFCFGIRPVGSGFAFRFSAVFRFLGFCFSLFFRAVLFRAGLFCSGL